MGRPLPLPPPPLLDDEDDDSTPIKLYSHPDNTLNNRNVNCLAFSIRGIPSSPLPFPLLLPAFNNGLFNRVLILQARPPTVAPMKLTLPNTSGSRMAHIT